METRIEELYKNLDKYLEELKELGLYGDRAVNEELFKLYAKDSEELTELLIQEGKAAGQIDSKMEQKLRDAQKELIKKTEKLLNKEMT